MKDKKWWIFIGIAIILIVVLLVYKSSLNNNEGKTNEQIVENTIIGNTKIEEDGTKVNISEKFIETKKIDGLEISNIKFSQKDNVTQILADVKNTTDKKVEGFDVMLKIMDKEGNMIIGLGSFIPTVEANGTATLNTTTLGDYVDAYDFEIIKTNAK